MSLIFVRRFLCVIYLICTAEGWQDVWQDVKCDEEYYPENCDFNSIPLLTLEDYDRCAPAELPPYARNYFLAWAGRGLTYRESKKAFKRIHIKPKMLTDVSNSSLEITVLGQKVAFPVGVSPSALHKLANPEGEKATAAGAAAMNTIMILSSLASTSIEEVAESVKRYWGSSPIMWMQLYIFANRSYTVDIVRRAERNGFKALVLTVDSNAIPAVFCNAKEHPLVANARLGNFPLVLDELYPAIATFDDIKWLKSITKLPIVAKGLLTGYDAQKAIRNGASAIFVSNHGGRQLDGVPATIDALSDVLKEVNKIHPRREVYLDSGIRDGFDVYKALALGAKMVFIGRPAIWGLAMDGAEGVKNVLNILKTEFYDVMRLAGSTNPSKIQSDTIILPCSTCK